LLRARRERPKKRSRRCSAEKRYEFPLANKSCVPDAVQTDTYFLIGTGRPELVHLGRLDYSSDHAHGHKMDKLRRTRSYQPVLTDIRSIARTGWFGSPQKCDRRKGQRMLAEIADAIAEDARVIFNELDAVQGGAAEVQHCRRRCNGTGV
jgi:hypothetical protein